MRKIANCALGLLASVLAGPAAVGQEKPKVVVEKPKIDLPVKVKTFDESGRAVLDRMIMEFRAARPLDVQINQKPVQGLVGQLNVDTELGRVLLNRANVRWIENGSLVGFAGKAQPLMEGDLKETVQEIERDLRVVTGDDLAQSLAALDGVQRATMKARRMLRTRKDLTERPSEDQVRALSQMQFFRVALQQPDTSPLAKARSAVDQAVVSVRQATSVEEVKKAFDEVEKSIAALRALLWDRKPEKD